MKTILHNMITKQTWNKARRLYCEGYGISYITSVLGITAQELNYAIQIPFNVHGPIRWLIQAA